MERLETPAREGTGGADKYLFQPWLIDSNWTTKNETCWGQPVCNSLLRSYGLRQRVMQEFTTDCFTIARACQVGPHPISLAAQKTCPKEPGTNSKPARIRCKYIYQWLWLWSLCTVQCTMVETEKTAVKKSSHSKQAPGWTLVTNI